MTTTTNGYKLGLTSTSGGFHLLSVLAIDPESQFKDYSTIVKLANGKQKGLGYPVATWHYGYLTEEQWTTLKSYCTAVSNDVYIATMNNNGDYVVYSAVMNMPDQYIVRATRYIDITITFTNLIAVA